jgi:DNA polymerase I-like protein with 3'-5' exonuclease and polymerase domains
VLDAIEESNEKEVKAKKPRTKRASAKPKEPKLTDDDLRRLQCEACPFLCYKTQDDDTSNDALDILIVSENYMRPMTYVFDQHDVRVKQTHLIECLPYGEKIPKKDLDKGSTCCMGRKLSLIEAHKPKLVLSVGYDCYKHLEKGLGNTPSGVSDFILMPSSYNGHLFWHYCIPEKGALLYAQESVSTVIDALDKVPSVEEGNDGGIEYVVLSEDIDPAFDWFEQQEIVTFDIETTGLNPFQKNDAGIDPTILSIAIGTKDRVFAFPLFHPQTPESFDSYKVLERLWDLATKVPMIAHNTQFELDWIGSILPDFEMLGVFHDTMAQVYLLTPPKMPKSLDACVRRNFGFGLKIISGIDVTNLYNTPLEQVLAYNALDVKYTHKLYEMQEAQLVLEMLWDLYISLQLPFIPAVTRMRRKGLLVDQEFAKKVGEDLQAQYTAAEESLFNIPEVAKFIKDKGSFNLDSTTQMRELMYNYVGVPTTQTSFDEKNLAKMKHPVAKAIVAVRKINKLHSTYILPYNKAEEGGGRDLCEDGLIHSSISTIRTVTGRLSTSPNIQNFPSRGGKKKYRSIIKAPPGHTMVEIDKSQIEYRCIASISGDKEMVHAINNGLDVHMYWAKRLSEEFKYLVKDRDDPKQMDDFRSAVKNQWTFPLCYGSLPYNVAGNLKLKQKDKNRLIEIVEDEFWSHHTGVKQWHQDLETFLKEHGYITSVFGRRFRPPLNFNEMINYGIQSAAHDMVAAEFTRLARMSYELDEPALCPINEIHDALVFVIPEEKFDDLIPVIIEVMVDVRKYDWVKVPIDVEVSVGPAMGSLVKSGTFSSAEWEFVLS